MKPISILGWAALALSLLSTVGCVTRGYPTHGGGKRFYREQQIVSAAINQAIQKLDLDGIPRAEVQDRMVLPVQVFSMAHSGGGVQSGSGIGVGGLIGGLFGFGAAAVASDNPSAAYPAAVAAQGAASAGSYASYAFESADDIRYLTGALIRELGSRGYTVRSANSEQNGGVLTILVSELGIDQNDLNLVVYGEKRLRARAVIEAFWVRVGDDGLSYKSLGKGGATSSFSEAFFLGFGPLSGEEIETVADEEVLP